MLPYVASGTGELNVWLCVNSEFSLYLDQTRGKWNKAELVKREKRRIRQTKNE